MRRRSRRIPVSAYGGVVVVNRPVTAALARRSGDAVRRGAVRARVRAGRWMLLAARSSLRVLELTEQRALDAELDYRRVHRRSPRSEARLAFGRDWMKVVCGDVSDEQWDDLLFAWRVVKHVTSNAIVLARGGQTLGIGAGQMSRVDAVRIAIEKARELGHSLEGAVLASDAFFPFADGPQLALDAGVTALIQPGARSATPR